MKKIISLVMAILLCISTVITASAGYKDGIISDDDCYNKFYKGPQYLEVDDKYMPTFTHRIHSVRQDAVIDVTIKNGNELYVEFYFDNLLEDLTETEISIELACVNKPKILEMAIPMDTYCLANQVIKARERVAITCTIPEECQNYTEVLLFIDATGIENRLYEEIVYKDGKWTFTWGYDKELTTKKERAIWLFMHQESDARGCFVDITQADLDKSNEIVQGCTTDYEKVCAIYTWVMRNVWYNLVGEYNETDYSKRLSGVCEGYTRILRRLLSAQGIPNQFLTVLQNEWDQLGHAAAIVYIDKTWMVLDGVDNRQIKQYNAYSEQRQDDYRAYGCGFGETVYQYCRRVAAFTGIYGGIDVTTEDEYYYLEHGVWPVKYIPEDGVKAIQNIVTLKIALPISMDAFKIEGYNYIKLRDLANFLNNTNKCFSVGWSDKTKTISLKSGEKYTPIGGEYTVTMKDQGKERLASPSKAKLIINGKEKTFTAYTINGANYFRLRDIAEAFDFNVIWDEQNQWVVIDTATSYKE